jgi:predicted PurR-regulated permease PerM
VSAIERTTRSVSKGIFGTALIQSALAWIGFVIVGAPAPMLLAFISLLLCSLQLGIVIIGIPLGIWLWTTDQYTAAIFIFIWSVFVSVIDSALKPILIGQNFPAPLWLVFAGVIGGLIAMGLVGLFIGPAILAVAYLLTLHWIKR